MGFSLETLEPVQIVFSMTLLCSLVVMDVNRAASLCVCLTGGGVELQSREANSKQAC